MKAYAAAFFVGALSSAMFIDSSVKQEVARIGKIALAIFTVLFLAAEVMVFAG